MRRVLVILCFWSLVLASFASAELNITTFISFQGKLANKTNGDAFTNSSLQINITTYNNFSDVKWGPYNFSNATDSNGVFDMVLGSTYELNLTPGMKYNLIAAVDLDSANFTSADDIYGDNSSFDDVIIVNAGYPADASELIMSDNITSVQSEFSKYAKLGGANFTGRVAVSEVLNASESLFVGGNVSLGEVNLTEEGDVEAVGNISLGQKITFALGEVIDNVLNGWVKVTGSLNVTGDIHTPGGVVIGGAPAAAIAGTLRFTNDIFQGYNGSDWVSISAGASATSPWSSSGGTVYYTIGNVGIGVSSPSSALNVSGNVGVGGNVTAKWFKGNGSELTGVITSGGGVGMWANLTSDFISPNESYSRNVNISGNLTIDYKVNVSAIDGNIKTRGNISATYLFGDGSELKGLANDSHNYAFNGSDWVGWSATPSGIPKFEITAQTTCSTDGYCSDVYSEGLLNVNDNFNVSDAGDLRAQGDVNITGDVFVQGDLNITGTTNIGNVNISGVTFSSGNIVAKNATFTGLNVTGSSYF
ncbi:hypothetical protein CMO89_02235, partial [Candidatus Woesearchaeota archaeon]|nr:hypothetical protein [Candidatus Woesearchaeota archaeon]